MLLSEKFEDIHPDPKPINNNSNDRTSSSPEMRSLFWFLKECDRAFPQKLVIIGIE
ncbi:hypothetical protein VB714_03970 [Spirulina sp. 06S082]|nr:hypothetical protein [Spirulina sp. 06S082]